LALYGKGEAEDPNIFGALDVPLEGRSSSVRSQIAFRFSFGKCRYQNVSFSLSSAACFFD
jgi:hypothetical protein